MIRLEEINVNGCDRRAGVISLVIRKQKKFIAEEKKMARSLHEIYEKLISSVCEIPSVTSVGKCGGPELPENGESDIDIYVFCERVPEISGREKIVNSLNDEEISVTAEYGLKQTRFWGTIDFLNARETEICVMYFTEDYMDAELNSVLNGERLDKEAGFFYPTGRCQTILKMHALCDKNFYIAGWREKLKTYPDELSEKVSRYHINKADDEESFGRAVSRGDVLFYHETAERALDHFLQALFATNKRFFPSRKRSIEYVDGFEIKPPDTNERLLKMIEFGAKPETLAQSHEVWNSLYGELYELITAPPSRPPAR